MTRINTNVSSLVAQTVLGRSNADLNQALTRLSTGLRINNGKDDPAGLIASENLRSDITSIRKAIGNTERASQVIATADSALGQVSSLLNDIRGLVTEAANTGALSQDQIDANQLQIDSSLEALNRIAQTTTFQGRKLLDGSLDFITTPGSNFTNVTDLKIDQANLGATGTVAVEINVTTAATQAQVDVVNIPNTQTPATGTVDFDIETTAAVGSTGTVNFAIETVASTQASTTLGGGADISLNAGATIQVDAVDHEEFDGVAGNIGITLIDDAGAGVGASPTVAIGGGGDLEITAEDGVTTAQNIIDAINAFDNGTGGIDFSASLSGGAGGDLYVTANDAGANGSLDGGVDGTNVTETIDITGTLAAGSGGDIDIDFAEANLGGAGTNVIGGAGSYTVQIDNTVAVNIEDIRAAIQSIAEVDTAVFNGTPGTNVYNSAPDTEPAQISLIGGVDQVITTETIDITAVAGQSGNISIAFEEADLSGLGTNITGSAGTGYTLQIDSTVGVTIGTIRTAIASIAEVDTAVFNGGPGTSTYNAAADAPPSTVALSGGADNGLTGDLVIELAGATGAEVLSFENGTSITQLINGINLVSDAIGVQAAANGTTLELTSTAYGSNAFVDLKVISEGTGSPNSGVFTDAVGLGDRQTGTDVAAAVNGVSANGDGNRLSINTATLDLSTSLAEGFAGTVSFSITGGGALFQLGPNVVSNQQARVGVRSVNTARLGAVSGKLFQLGTGGSASLNNDANLGAIIVEEAIDQITSLRGRLGAFERTTLQTNRNALGDTLVNLTEAESQIRDADFAVETAALTRAQILVQSGNTVLTIANQNPQNVLALLR